MFNIFVFIFIILVSCYLVINYNKLVYFDIFLLFVSSIILLFTVSYSYTKNKTFEGFDTNLSNNIINVETAITQYKKMNIEEDISLIKQQMTIYLTVFNSSSFNNTGNSWNNIVKQDNIIDPIKQKQTVQQEIQQITPFNFVVTPVFSRNNGLYLGNNSITGPLSNNMNIKFHNTFTVILVCKHGNLLVGDTNLEIELIKLYANSGNNNGLTMFIKKGSLHNTNNTQYGTLMIQYANTDAYECKVNKEDSFINFDKNNLTYYFIVKDTDNIRVLMMTEGSTTINVIAKFNIENIDITFSNKEMIINRSLNWNSSLFIFSIYNKALSDELVSDFYSHVMNEYLKNLDPNFAKMLLQYNNTVDILQTLLKCPYDNKVCDSCDTVTKWGSYDQLITASKQCKQSINDYCAINSKTNLLCKCWDTTSPLYNNNSCIIYRTIFSDGKIPSFENLSVEDVEYIKKKYNLLHSHEFPVPTTTVPNTVPNNTTTVVDDIKKTNLIKNIQEHDWNKIKIKDIDDIKSINIGDNNEKNIDDVLDNIVTSAKNVLDKNTLNNNILDKNTLDKDVLNKNMNPQNINNITEPDSFFNKFMKIILPQ